MSEFLHQFFFGIYPYVCFAVFLVGSLIRFDREQYTWKSDSSQMLRTGQLRWGSNLFHIGILGIFFGHLFGLLVPVEFWHAVGLEPAAKQLLAMAGGGAAGLLCLAGMVLLLQRRLGEARIRVTTRPMDLAVLFLLLAQLLLGLYSITESWQHRDGSMMLKLVYWAQYIATFRNGAAGLIVDVPLVFKAHLILGLTVFLVFPFSRLVHIWSGFAAVTYLTRAYQIVRSR